MNSGEMKTYTYIFLLQGSYKFISAYLQRVNIKSDNVQMPCMNMRPWYPFHGYDFRDILHERVIVGGKFTPYSIELVQPGELVDAYGCLYVKHVVLISRFFHFVLRNTSFGVPLPCVS